MFNDVNCNALFECMLIQLSKIRGKEQIRKCDAALAPELSNKRNREKKKKTNASDT